MSAMAEGLYESLIDQETLEKIDLARGLRAARSLSRMAELMMTAYVSLPGDMLDEDDEVLIHSVLWPLSALTARLVELHEKSSAATPAAPGSAA